MNSNKCLYMMEHFGGFLRLLLVFLVATDGTYLHSSQAAVANILPQNAESNPTQNSTNSFIEPQQQPQTHYWESPDSVRVMNHTRNTVGIRFSDTLTPFVGPTLQQQPKIPVLLAPQSQQQRQLTDRVADTISYSVLRFALEVGSQLSENAYFSKSEVFSPLSVMTALSLLLAGAKGRSYQQLKPMFGFDLDTDLQRLPNYAQHMHTEFGNLLQDIEQQDLSVLNHRNNEKWRDSPVHYNIRGPSQKSNEPVAHVIKVANGLFAQLGYNLNPSYSDVVSKVYRSEISQLDFRNKNEGARQHINAWVSKNTYGKIPNIITNAIPQSTNIILASVLYFKGFWENTFFDSATSWDNFYPEGEKKPAIRVQMMATGGVFPYYDSPDLNCRIIGLPYKGNLTTMYVIQPRQSSRAVLKNFQSKITAELIDDMISKMVYRTAVLAFPKMHIQRQLNMKEILKHFGVVDIFSSTASDLSLIGSLVTQNIQPSVSQVSQAPSRLWHADSQRNTLRPELTDRFHDKPLFFSSRFGEIGNGTTSNNTIEGAQNDQSLSENVTASINTSNNTMSDNVMNLTTTPTPLMEELIAENRKKRQILNPLSLLEQERLTSSFKSDLYVEDILHKVDFEVNEHGTEAAAATLTYLRRSGTDVLFRADSPFLLLIRHDPSKLILFYGIVNEPES